MSWTEALRPTGRDAELTSQPAQAFIPFEDFVDGATVVSTPLTDPDRVAGSSRFAAALDANAPPVQMPGTVVYERPEIPVALVAQALATHGLPDRQVPSSACSAHRTFPVMGAQLWCQEFTAQIVGVTPTEILCQRADGYDGEVYRQSGTSFVQMFQSRGCLLFVHTDTAGTYVGNAFSAVNRCVE